MKSISQNRNELLTETRQRADQSVERIALAYRDFPWHDPYVYATWLAQTYHYVRRATRLLTRAASVCKLDEEPLHLALVQGIREEQGHENLAVQDLVHLGYDIADFPELEETACYHQTLFFAIEQEGPVALLGYFLPLEGLAANKMDLDLDTVLRHHGAKAASFLKVHCKLDQGHYAEGLKQLSNLTDPELEVVSHYLAYSSYLYGRLIDRVGRANSLVARVSA